MTRLYISVDIEGICGVVTPAQCAPTADAKAYHQAVDQMALEVNTVVEAALSCGVSSVLVNDSHLSMANLRLQHLAPHLSDKITLLSGKPKPTAMAAGLTQDFDVAMHIGYHAKAGTLNAVLCHTFQQQVCDMSINGVSYGEGGVNALYASMMHQVPVILGSGDDAYCREMAAFCPDIQTVCTKYALGFAAAQNRPWPEVKSDYETTVKRALEAHQNGDIQRPIVEPPYALVMTLSNSLYGDTLGMIPGWERLDGVRLCYKADDFYTLYMALQSGYSILSYANTILK